MKNNSDTKLRARILSCIPKSKYTFKMLIERLNCTEREIKLARKIQNEAESQQLTLVPVEKKLNRKKLNLDLARDFIDFIISVGSLEQTAHLSTTLKFDSGEKQIVSQSILTGIKHHIICDYIEFCKNIGKPTLSQSTLYKILETIKPSKKKALGSLDYFYVNSREGFETLLSMSAQFPNKNNITERLKLAQKYLGQKYQLNCKVSSECASHCITHALSDCQQAQLATTCNHYHEKVCDECENIFHSFEMIRNELENLNIPSKMKNENLYDYENAKKEILKYMAHILRSAQQYKAKTEAMHTIRNDPQAAFLVRDWSQKVLEKKFREGQNSYFGKMGMSVHIDVFMFLHAGKLKKVAYVTIVFRCKQGMIDVMNLSKYVLKQFHTDFPVITKLYVKSDNAGCYSSNG